MFEKLVNTLSENLQKELSKNSLESSEKEKIETNFKLPIHYVKAADVHSLSPVVSSDLELVETGDTKSVYDFLFLPKHTFAKKMICEWSKQYCTNTDFLNDNQTLLRKMGHYKTSISTNKYQLNCEKLMGIWEDVKHDKHFLETYGYMEWSALMHLNQSPLFLQILSSANVLSPVFSLFLPVLFFILPFIILKIQRIPITFDVYIDVLKSIGKNHFIGKALTNIKSLTIDKIAYLFLTFGLYLMQIYQNVSVCQRFYRNITKINDSLLEMQQYTEYSMASMDSFLEISQSLPSFTPFCVELRQKYYSLQKLHSELKNVNAFERTAKKFQDVGYMLKCYFELYSNKEYDDCFRYSIGFEGYMNNLLGVHENLSIGKISYADFDISKKCCFKKQYYPHLMDEDPVKNDCSFEKNMIISSPNKSGKTTILKTTTLNIIFSQQLGCGFYDSAIINPYTHIHSYLNIPDTSGRDSLFQAESRRCKDIIDIIAKYDDPIKYRHFCIFDELYSGTNPDEASKAGHAFLKYLAKYENVNFILTTHYFAICKKFINSHHIQNYKMNVNINTDGTFEYTYKIKRGISKIKGAIRVLKDMDYPAEIIETIEKDK